METCPTDSPLVFETPEGITLQSREPIVKAAMLVLAERWPRCVAFAELVEQARKKLSTDFADSTDGKKAEEALGQALLGFYVQASTSLVELWLRPPNFITAVGDRPAAVGSDQPPHPSPLPRGGGEGVHSPLATHHSPPHPSPLPRGGGEGVHSPLATHHSPLLRASRLAREQAKTKQRVTNLRHESVFLGDFERQLLQRLDGTRDRAMLAKELAELVRQGALTVEKDGQPVRAEQALAGILGEAIDAQLATMARSALLEVTLRVG